MITNTDTDTFEMKHAKCVNLWKIHISAFSWIGLNLSEFIIQLLLQRLLHRKSKDKMHPNTNTNPNTNTYLVMSSQNWWMESTYCQLMLSHQSTLSTVCPSCFYFYRWIQTQIQIQIRIQILIENILTLPPGTSNSLAGTKTKNHFSTLAESSQYLRAPSSLLLNWCLVRFSSILVLLPNQSQETLPFTKLTKSIIIFEAPKSLLPGLKHYHNHHPQKCNNQNVIYNPHYSPSCNDGNERDQQ